MKWPTGALDSIAILDRQSIHPSEVEAATPYLGLEHLDGDGGIDCIQTVGSASLKSNKFQFSDRHVLFGKLRPYLRKIVRPEFSGVCSTDIIPILPKEGVSRDYLFYFLRTPDAVNLATSRCSGANLPRLGPKQLASFQIPLPPLDEQKRIAGILDAADALRAKRREALAELDTLLQSTFLDMFGDPVTNPMGWETPALSEVTDEIYRYPTYFGIVYQNEGVPEIRGELIGKAGKLDTDCDRLRFISQTTSNRFPRTRLIAGDLVMSVRGTIGKVGIVPPELCEANITANLIRISPNRSKISPVYLLHVALGRYFVDALSQASSSTTIKTIKASDLKAIPIPLPPLERQGRFGAVVESVERQEASQRTHLTELDTLFTSLQARAFRGDL